MQTKVKDNWKAYVLFKELLKINIPRNSIHPTEILSMDLLENRIDFTSDNCNDAYYTNNKSCNPQEDHINIFINKYLSRYSSFFTNWTSFAKFVTNLEIPNENGELPFQEITKYNPSKKNNSPHFWDKWSDKKDKSVRNYINDLKIKMISTLTGNGVIDELKKDLENTQKEFQQKIENQEKDITNFKQTYVENSHHTYKELYDHSKEIERQQTQINLLTSRVLLFQDTLRQLFINNSFSSIQQSLKHINDDYWKSNFNPVAYFLNLDSYFVKSAVNTTDAIVTPSDDFVVRSHSNKTLKVNFQDLVNTLTNPLKNISCLAIVGNDGVGKSTLLNWFAHKLYNQYLCFFLRDIKLDLLQNLTEIAKILIEKNVTTVFIFVDDIAEEKYLHNLTELLETLLDFEDINFIIIAAERTTRFDPFVLPKIQKYFGADLYVLSNHIVDKEKVFEKICKAIQSKDPSIEIELLNSLKPTFLEPTLISISQSTYNFLENLGLQKPEFISFPWKDWELLANKSNKKEINNLYLIVAFFYQFNLPITIFYQNQDYLPNINFTDIENIIRAIDNDKTKPINYIEIENNGKLEKKLYLQNEKLGLWYFQNKKNYEAGKSYFNNFLANIKSKPSAEIFRDLRKKLIDLNDSQFAGILTFQKHISIIDSYLSTDIAKNTTKEWEKMMLEKALAYLYYKPNNYIQEAAQILTQIARTYRDNNHCRDVLAKLYEENNQLQLALDYYFEILDNPKGEYALTKILALLDKITNTQTILIANNNQINTNSFIEIFSKYPRMKQFNLLKKLTSNENYLHLVERFVDVMANDDFNKLQFYYQISLQYSTNPKLLSKSIQLLQKAVKVNNELNKVNNENKFHYKLYLSYLNILFTTFQERKLNNFIKHIKSKFSETQIKPLLTIHNNLRFSLNRFIIIEEFADYESKRNYFEKELKRAKAKAFHRNNDEENFYGYLLLKSIRYSCKNDLKEIYYQASSSLIGFYSNKSLLPTFGNKDAISWQKLGVSLFNELIEEGYQIERSVCNQLLSNLQQFYNDNYNKENALFINQIIKNICISLTYIDDKPYKNYPFLYNIAANALRNLGKYDQSLSYYSKALRLLKNDFHKSSKYENEKYQAEYKGVIYNNIAMLNFIAFKEKYRTEYFKPNLKTALYYSKEALKLKPDGYNFKINYILIKKELNKRR